MNARAGQRRTGRRLRDLDGALLDQHGGGKGMPAAGRPGPGLNEAQCER